jgi:hypothetical protein
LVRRDERLRDSLGRDQYGGAFVGGKVEQQRDMPARDDAALADFELPRVDHRERVFAFIDDRPAVFATCRFAQVAWISCGKFDQCLPPIRPSGRVDESAPGRSWSRRRAMRRLDVHMAGGIRGASRVAVTDARRHQRRS